MPGKKVDCKNYGKSMRSDNFIRHEKNCNLQVPYPLETEPKMRAETKRKYVPSFIW